MKIYTISINLNLYDYKLFITGGEQGMVVGFKKINTEFQKRPTRAHTNTERLIPVCKLCMCSIRRYGAIYRIEKAIIHGVSSAVVPPRDSLVILDIEICIYDS